MENRFFKLRGLNIDVIFQIFKREISFVLSPSPVTFLLLKEQS